MAIGDRLLIGESIIQARRLSGRKNPRGAAFFKEKKDRRTASKLSRGKLGKPGNLSAGPEAARSRKEPNRKAPAGAGGDNNARKLLGRFPSSI